MSFLVYIHRILVKIKISTWQGFAHLYVTVHRKEANSKKGEKPQGNG
jgi:hypothetical protein